MDTLAIQICVARADLFLCAVAALPWGWMLTALTVSALLIVGARHCHRIRAPDDAAMRHANNRTGTKRR